MIASTHDYLRAYSARLQRHLCADCSRPVGSLSRDRCPPCWLRRHRIEEATARKIVIRDAVSRRGWTKTSEVRELANLSALIRRLAEQAEGVTT